MTKRAQVKAGELAKTNVLAVLGTVLTWVTVITIVARKLSEALIEVIESPDVLGSRKISPPGGPQNVDG